MKRVALCISNSNYYYLPKLDFALSDANEIKKSLDDLGFYTEIYDDLKSDDIGIITDKITELSDLTPDVFLLYYAGHGCQIEGQNLLLPIDFNPALSPGCKKHSGYPVEEIVNHLNKYSGMIKIIIFDACRETMNSRGIEGHGFAPIYAPENTIIAFSTSPNSFAKEDSMIKHGIYTYYLLENIKLPYVPIEYMLKKVRQDTIKHTSGRQVPWEHTSLIDYFYFNRNTFYSEFVYNKFALADYYYKDLQMSSEIIEIIETLRTYNFYTQNTAFKDINKLDFEKEYTIDELFVLGRNIYQSACGNSIEAQRFLMNFNRYYAPLEIKLHILNGIAYEMYFDCKNLLRGKFKNKLMENVMSLIENEEYRECAMFICSKINKDDRLLYLPGMKNMFKIIVSTITNDKEYSVSIMTINDNNYYFSADKNEALMNKNQIIEHMSKELMCPRASLVLEFCDKNITDDSKIVFDVDYCFKKKW